MDDFLGWSYRSSTSYSAESKYFTIFYHGIINIAKYRYHVGEMWKLRDAKSMYIPTIILPKVGRCPVACGREYTLDQEVARRYTNRMEFFSLLGTLRNWLPGSGAEDGTGMGPEGVRLGGQFSTRNDLAASGEWRPASGKRLECARTWGTPARGAPFYSNHIIMGV